MVPQTTFADVPVRMRPSAGDSGRNASRSSRGADQSMLSAANEITSTAPAAQLNSQVGIGRSARPVRPCAAAADGNSRATTAAAPAARASARGDAGVIDYECSRPRGRRPQAALATA